MFTIQTIHFTSSWTVSNCCNSPWRKKDRCMYDYQSGSSNTLTPNWVQQSEKPCVCSKGHACLPSLRQPHWEQWRIPVAQSRSAWPITSTRCAEVMFTLTIQKIQYKADNHYFLMHPCGHVVAATKLIAKPASCLRIDEQRTHTTKNLQLN